MIIISKNTVITLGYFNRGGRWEGGALVFRRMVWSKILILSLLFHENYIMRGIGKAFEN